MPWVEAYSTRIDTSLLKIQVVGVEAAGEGEEFHLVLSGGELNLHGCGRIDGKVALGMGADGEAADEVAIQEKQGILQFLQGRANTCSSVSTSTASR